MTRKDYILIAKVLNKTKTRDDCGQLHDSHFCFCDECYRRNKIILSFSEEFLKDNPRFDENKFYKVCNE